MNPYTNTNPYAAPVQQPQQPWPQQPPPGVGLPPQPPGPAMFMPSTTVPSAQGPQGFPPGVQQGGPGIGGLFPGAPVTPTAQVAEVLAQSAMRSYGERFIQGGSDLLQRQMGWFSSAAFYHLFNVTHQYVGRKLRILLLPFLTHGPRTRARESISHATFKAPRHDVNSPDLYIPTMALFTWVLLVSLGHVIRGTFTTDIMYSKLWRGGIVWAIQTVIIRMVLGLGGHVASVPTLEIAAYAGYTYFYACIVSLANSLIGAKGTTIALFYSWICLAAFLRETLKRVIVDEMRVGASDPRQRYMIFAVMLAQGFWLYILS